MYKRISVQNVAAQRLENFFLLHELNNKRKRWLRE